MIDIFSNNTLIIIQTYQSIGVGPGGDEPHLTFDDGPGEDELGRDVLGPEGEKQGEETNRGDVEWNVR